VEEKSKEIGVIITEDGLAYATVLSTSWISRIMRGSVTSFSRRDEKPVKLS